MSKMYQVIDTSGNLGISAEGFATREDAKGVRNNLNTKHNSAAKGDAKPRFVICRGEDHPRGTTDGNDHTLRSKWL